MVTEYITVDGKSELFENVKTLRYEIFHGEEFLRDKDNSIHILYVINDNSRGAVPVATGSAVPSDNGFYEIYGVGVLPQFRRNNVARELVECLKSECKNKGAKGITAECNIDVLEFLHKCGLAHSGVSYKKENGRYIKCEESFVFGSAKWLEFDSDKEAVIAKNTFTADNTENATLYVTGLGYCDVYINGKKISDYMLSPAWTNYAARDTKQMCYPIYDTMTYRILYEKIDVSEFLVKGENNIVFHIGGGWFAQHECRNEGVIPYGNIKLCYSLVSGGKILSQSDEKVLYKKSFIQRASLYYGEDHDYRAGGYDFKNTHNAGDWKNATVTEKPLAVLSEADFPKDKVIRSIEPERIFKMGDIAIYDLGENVSGQPVIEFIENASADERCTIRYAEELYSDGGLNFDSAGWSHRIQKDTFIYDGVKGVEYHPYFTWRAGRYLEITGRVNFKEFRVVHTDIKEKSHYKSSNETIQWLYDAYVRTQLNNIHGCIPSDCPHRERLGYTGDGQLTVNAVMTVFNAKEMYRKWIRDIADCQDIYNGHVQHTAPFYGGGGGPGGWGGAMVIVPYAFYKHYGDTELIKEYYNNMVNYLDYMEAHSEKGLVVREEVAGWCLGDWCWPKEVETKIPEEFVNTYFYLKTLKMTIEISEALGKDSTELGTRYEKVKKAFSENFYNEETGAFCGSVQSADAYGYDLGLGSDKTLKLIVEKYEKLGQFDCGIFGTDILIRVLCRNGHKDLAFKLLTSEKEHTFYNMKKHGATTLWENWGGEASHSHPMFGAVIEYIVECGF